MGGSHAAVGRSGKPGGGNERYSPNFIHQQPHTESATNHGACVRLRACAHGTQVLTVVYICISETQTIVPSCTNCLRSVVIFEQSAAQWCVLTLSGRHSSACYGNGFDPRGLSRTRTRTRSVPGRRGARATTATLIDWVNKCSASVPVRCSHTPSVFTSSKNQSDLMSALPNE